MDIILSIIQFLIFLHHGQQKFLVGELVQVGRDIYFEYNTDFIATQIEISPLKLKLKRVFTMIRSEYFKL